MMSAFAAPAMAQTRVANGTIQVERALTLSNVQPMSFVATRRNVAGATAVEEPGGASTAPALIDITGDPGRLYRIQLPEAVSAELADSVIDGFQVWSETMGDVTKTMTGRLNSEGHDRLRISGVLTTTAGMTISNVSTAVPVSIDYE
jgi:hypothetical protein